MDLLEKASVILTPTAYNNGEALCVKPSDGSGDFDFSRNSAATRVNAQGLVENVQILSSNLVQNGDFSEEGVQEVSNGSFSQEGVQLVTNGSFDTDSDWIKGSGWSISGGKANFNGTSNSNLRQDNVTEQNKIYKVSFEVSDYVSGIVQVNIGDNLAGEDFTFSSNGVFVFYTTADSGTTQMVRFRPTTSAEFSIDNVSVREVGQDWTLGTGWSIGEDKASSDGSVAANSYLISTGDTLTIGKTYKVQYTVLDYISGKVKVTAGQATQSFVNADGTYTEYMVATTTESVRVQANSNFIGSITNISVKEVGMDWDLGSGWSIAENKAVATNSSNSNLEQVGITITNTKKYKINFTISDYTTGAVRPMLGAVGAVPGTFVSANGTYTEVLTANNNFDRIVFRTGGSAFNGSVTNISVIEISTDTNLPRISYENFSYQDALGSEEIVNGTFDSDTAWNKGTGWSIANGKAIKTAGNSGFLSQNSGLGSNTYKLTFTISDVTNGSLSLMADFSTSVQSFTSDGDYVVYYQPNGTNVVFLSNATFNGSIDNVSVKEYLGQIPIPNSGCGSWLWEPQTTQLVTYSEDFSQWNLAGTLVLESGYLAPDGTNNATKITSSDLTGFLSVGGFLSSTTKSIYARSVSGTGTVKLLSKNDNTNNTFTLTEQWQRFDVNNTTTAPTLLYGVDFRNDATLNEIILWGANATNDQDYVTSYIPTNGSQVTRNQDLCTNGGSLATINSTEGTLYAEIAKRQEDNDNFILISLNNAASNSDANSVTIGFNNNTDFYFRVKANGSLSFIEQSITSNKNQFYKVALKYKSGNISAFIDGVNVASNTTAFSFGVVLDNLSFDYNGNSSLPFFGKTKAVAVWKEALSDEELQSLTTI